MASIKILSSGAFQIRVTSKHLPKPFYATFDTREQAQAYSDQLTKLLAQGIVPQALLQDASTVRTKWTLQRCIAEYIRHESLAVSEVKLLDTVRAKLDGVRTEHLNYAWAEAWIISMKRQDNLAPSTIRHRHGALARCLDWMCRKHGEILAQNPLRLLKRGFATYTEEDARAVMKAGGALKTDVWRDRRLEPGEEERILSHLADMPAERTCFLLALESAMRMRECYTLDRSQINFSKQTIHLETSKNGDNRQVPMTSTIMLVLKEYLSAAASEIKRRDGLVFPFWNGDRSVYVLDRASSDLSRQFRFIFRLARVKNFHFHDLRHEATCRLYEKTDLSDVLIARITGHRDPKMLKRYASLRGSDLAVRLW